jgi:hypothetical protein
MPHNHHHCDTCSHEASECSCCCHDHTCSTEHDHHHHHHHHEDFSTQLLSIADEAWMEILKEKIKDQIRSSNGKHLDDLAKMVAEYNETRWKNKMSAQHTIGDFRNKVSSFFGN